MRFGGVHFFVKAVNQERFFSLLAQKNRLFFLTRTSHTTAHFKTSFFCQKQVAKQLKDAGITIEKQIAFGPVAQLMSFLKRFGILAGLLVAFVITFFAQQCVFKTTIIGLESIDKAQVEQVLLQSGFKGFAFKRAIDTGQIEKSLLTIEKISMASVIVRGNTIVVSIKERVENTLQGPFEPLKSNYDGIITSIQLVSGTLKVKVGQMVRVGDVLVEPFVFDSANQKRPVKPQAKIIAKVWYVGQEKHMEKKVETVRTGKKQTVSFLTFLGIPLSTQNQGCTFETYEVEQSSVCISTNNFLPIYRHFKVFYQTKQITVEQPFESVKEQILQKAKQKSLNLLGEYDIIKKEYFNITSNAQITFVEYVIEVEKRIDKE